MRRLVQGDGSSTPVATTPVRTAVIISPWCGSAVPWFSLTVGLLLGGRSNPVTFLLDDMPFGPIGRRWRFELMCIRSVLSLVARRHHVMVLSSFSASSPADEEDLEAIDRLAHLNIVWAQRGELDLPLSSIEDTAEQLRASNGRIARALAVRPMDLLFVPGGVWGNSGLWTRHARRAGIRIASYDSGGYGVLLLAADGIACQLQDIPKAFAMLNDQATTARERDLIETTAMAEIGKRRSGKDKFASQVQGTQRDERYNGGVLIALNSPWDSAALGLHLVYSSTQEWIIETVRHVLQATEAPVLVRQHPVERLAIARSSDDYRELLKKHFGDHLRLHFIAAEDPVNSYDLLEQVCAVVVYTSTIGIEAVTQGKPVLTESSSYYSKLGFVFKANSAEHYRSLLSEAIAGHLEVTAEMQRDAVNCYYITQCCNWVHTPFNVPDFPTWSGGSLSALARHPSVLDILESVETNVPVAYLNHRRRFSAADKSEDRTRGPHPIL
jgi:hypothetical protein